MYPDDILTARAVLSYILPWVMLAWLIHLLNVMTRYTLNRLFALYPRSLTGLTGIITSPLLHGDFQHLAVNTTGFIALSALIAVQGFTLWIAVTVGVAILGGFFTWLLESGPCVGASGIIFGYLGFVIIYGMASGRPGSYILGAIAAFVYGKVLWGITPGGNTQNSWIAHLGGLLAGIAIALYFAAPRV